MTLTDNVVRGSNALVIVLGLALLSYGGYLFTICKGANTVNGAAVGLGTLDVLFGLLIFFAFRNLFVLRLYGLVMGLLVVIELIVAILFLVDSGRVTGNAKTCAEDNITTQAETFRSAGWILLAVAVFQAITLSVVFLQVCMVDRPFDESASSPLSATLSSSLNIFFFPSHASLSPFCALANPQVNTGRKHFYLLALTPRLALLTMVSPPQLKGVYC